MMDKRSSARIWKVLALSVLACIATFVLACGENEDKSATFNDRDGYENRVAAAIEQIELEVEQLEARAEDAAGDRPDEFQAEADTFKSARADLQNYYEMLRDADTAEEWNKAKALIDRFEETYPEASRFICCA